MFAMPGDALAPVSQRLPRASLGCVTRSREGEILGAPRHPAYGFCFDLGLGLP